MTTTRTILLSGATGFQGRGFVKAAEAHNSEATEGFKYKIVALSRNPESRTAKRFAASEHVTVYKADLNDPKSVRAVFDAQGGKGAVWGVFCVLPFPGLGTTEAHFAPEERQGMALVDLALEYEVKHFVYSSAEHGGDDASVAMFRAAKVHIEQKLKAQPESTGMRWTILRPGFFLQNFTGATGKFTYGILSAGLKPDTCILWIDAEDIGRVALAAIDKPHESYSKVFTVANGSATMPELGEAYKRGAGHALPTIPSFFAKTLLKLNGQARGVVDDCEREYQIRIQLAESKGEEQDDFLKPTKALMKMRTIEEWAQNHEAAEDGYNQVTILGLLLGRQ